MGTENEKSTNAYEQTGKLQLELKKEQHINAMLQDRITRVEEERKTRVEDNRIEHQNDPSLNSKPGENAELNILERAAQSSNKKANINGNGGEPVCTRCQNNFIVLEDLNESCKIIDDIQTKGRIDRDKANKVKSRPVLRNTHTKRQKTVIVGDSIVKRLQQHKLAKAAKHSVGIKCFPGTTVRDMYDYVKPVLRKKPNTIILHVGTNSTANKEASEIINDNDSLCQQI